MSDMEFRGIAPKTPAGESMFFYSMDFWIELCECIQATVAPEFMPYPSMDAKYAESIANALENVLPSGQLEAFYEASWRRFLGEQGEADEEVEEEVRGWIEHMLEITRTYIVFLKECGGCEPL